MAKRLPSILLFLATAVIGGALAWWLMPQWNDMRDISRIAADDHMVRERGWHWLTSARPEDPVPRAGEVIDRINETLTDAGDDALLHAADVLRPLELWNWRAQPIELALRELMRRAESHIGDQQLAAIELRDCPFDAPKDDVIAITQHLVMSDDPNVRTLAMRHVLGWAGLARVDVLRSITVPEDDPAMERLRRLAMSWGRLPDRDDSDHVESTEVLEALLLQMVRADPDDASGVITRMQQWEREEQPAFAYALRHSNDPEAERQLRRMADQGRDAARFALHARDAAHDAERAAAIANRAGEPTWRRRLAAWRMSDIDRELLDELLTASAADADESVYAVALLAERHHDRGALRELAETWLRDLENDRKRAGAVLAALIGEHAELLDEVSRLPDEPRVRTIARLAAASARDSAEDEEVLELGYRALRKPDGDFDADILLTLLAAGHDEVLSVLFDLPRGDWRMAIQQRAMLIERFLPRYHREAGRPISGNQRTITLHFDWLRARYLLAARRIEFDREQRTYHAGGDG